jgi:hypothetical protein
VKLIGDQKTRLSLNRPEELIEMKIIVMKLNSVLPEGLVSIDLWTIGADSSGVVNGQFRRDSMVHRSNGCQMFADYHFDGFDVLALIVVVMTITLGIVAIRGQHNHHRD